MADIKEISIGSTVYDIKDDNARSRLTTLESNALQSSDVVNDVVSTDTDKPLSANMGKELQDEINNLKARGRFLTLWNCATGLASTNPPSSPYTYKAGDYFIVGTIASGSASNYKPNGSSYTTGTASTTVETASVSVDDVYYYDGTAWKLQINTQKTVSFSSIAGQPSDNTNLATALNGKVNTNTAITGDTKCKITYDSKGLVTSGADLQASDIPNLTLSKITDVTATATELNYVDGVTSSIQTQLNGKQDTLPTLQSGKFLTNNGTTLSWDDVTINDATLTITQGGVTKGTFTANADSNVTINLEGNNTSYTSTCPAITISDGLATWVVAHNLDTNNVIANLYDVSSGKEISKGVTIVDENTISVTFKSSSNISSGDYKIVVLAGGSTNILSRNIGEIVASTLPLTDSWLHLLDGSLLSGNGIYGSFVDYIANLYEDNTNANYFTTEELWQQSISTYGSCGKFVYNSINNTVRLPKITGFTEGTITPTELGNLTQAGLPNITGKFSSMSFGKRSESNTYTTNDVYAEGSFYSHVAHDNRVSPSTTNNKTWGINAGLSIDASRSSSTYGRSSTVQPQSIKVFYYIVVSNSTKTEIEVDIDEIATDLNSKADTDLSNLNNTGKGIVSNYAMPSSTYDSLTLGSSGTSYTAPADGWFTVAKATTAENEYIVMINTSNNVSMYTDSGGNLHWVRAFVPASKGDQVTVEYYAGGATQYFRFVYANGSRHEAS